MNIYRGRTHTEVYLASLLYDSIDDQDISSVSTLLVEKKTDPNIVLPRRGVSPFHLAIGGESEDFALRATMAILQHGGDPNVKSDEGLTPLHIAAAWGRTKILQLLLNCGGDPQITDNCYKTPLHYAVSEGCDDAASVIRDFLQVSMFADYCKGVPYTMTLDKLLLNAGGIVGEYEVAKNMNNSIELENLPKTNSNDYVLNWCQLLTEESANFTDDASPNDAFWKSESKDVLNPFDSSCEVETRKHQKATSRRRKADSFCKYKESFRESGILTLPESAGDDSTIDDYLQSFVKSDVHTVDNALTASTMKNNDTPCSEVVEPLKNKDTSSDYCTCTEGSEDFNVLEQNICDLSSSPESSKNLSLLKRQSSSDDQSFVSISEVYRYSDPSEGIVLYEKRVLVPSIASSSINESVQSNVTQSSLPKYFNYDTDTLRRELSNQGFDPGPITNTTKRVYLRKLYHLKKQTLAVPVAPECKKVYSRELQKTLKVSNWTQNMSEHCALEDSVRKQFTNPDPSRRWREGTNKSCFTYLLLDPRITQNLPCRADQLPAEERWEIFLSAIFYVGKGKRSRPYAHLNSAIAFYNQANRTTDSAKLNRIIDIWRDNCGVICLHIFQNVMPVEAYTREAAMIGALGTQNITNMKIGDFYGVAATWNQRQKNLFGTFLLYRGMKIFLNEGERQLFPNDID